MITDQLTALLQDAVAAARAAGDLTLPSEHVDISLELPKNKQFGDYASNLALALQKQAGLPPREIAARLVKHLPGDQGLIDRVEIAGPGFMNFYLKPDWLHDTLVQIDEQDTAYGKNESRKGEKTLIEFVSANPTGPISVVNGRAAALGDSLGNLLVVCGAHVAREFYVNDALNSTQMDKFAQSVELRYLQQLGHPLLITAAREGDVDVVEPGVPQSGRMEDLPLLRFPQDFYRGEYVKDIARDILAEIGLRFAGSYVKYPAEPLPAEARSDEADPRAEQSAAYFRGETPRRMIAAQKAALEAFGVRFDRWFYESSLYEAGTVARAIEEMRARGFAYEKDGAVWLKTTELSGDDQDRVLVRSNEKETYVAADAAYHKDKFDRGFSRLINIWGADHHGYVERLKAGIAALGYDSARCELILTQMVLLLRDGEPVRGGKRTGDIIPLVDLVEEIGKDAARFYCMLNSYETTATFDLELAKKQSSENPVFYAQYAHARCCNVLRTAKERGVTVKPATSVNRSLLTHEKELDLLRKLADYPREVRIAADLIAPHRLTAYVREIGQALHQFYEECPALREAFPVAPDLRDARLALFNATRIVVRNLLALLGVSAPEKM